MINIVTKMGIEVDGKMSVAAVYDEITPMVFANGKQSKRIFKCKKDDKASLILLTHNNEDYYEFDTFSNIIFANEICIGVSCFEENKGEKFALLDTELDLMTDYIYDAIEPLTDTIYKVKKDGLWGVIDDSAHEIIPNKYSEITFDKINETFTIKV